MTPILNRLFLRVPTPSVHHNKHFKPTIYFDFYKKKTIKLQKKTIMIGFLNNKIA